MFERESSNILKAVLTKQKQHLSACLDDCEPPANANPGNCIVAERGVLRRRRSSVGEKLKSRLVLQMRRFSVLQSNEYRHRLQREFEVPRERDVSASALGLLRATLDPTFRDQQIGDIWLYTNGTSDRSELRERLIEEAKENHDRQNRRGSFSAGSTKLRHSLVAVMSSPPNSPPAIDSSPAKQTDTPLVLRRSERLKKNRNNKQDS